MGAWGVQIFDNDEAMDWTYDLEESSDLSVVTAALEAVTNPVNGALGAMDCCNALAAAEVVAALAGKATAALPEEVAAWVNGKPAPDGTVVAKAKDAVRSVLDGSELRGLWAETDDFEAWTAAVDDLIARLA